MTSSQITLGENGPTTSSLGLGCMGLSGAHGHADEQESIATIHTALDAGVTLLDTGDFYGSGHNEMLLGRALRGRRREDYQLSVKFGALCPPGGMPSGFDGRPQSVPNYLSYSLTRLGVDHVDVYRPARLDPDVPIEETIGAIAEQVQRGYVRHIGLSEVGPETIRRAAAVHPICDLQIEYSLLTREVEHETLATCRELGIGITAYGVLSHGLIGLSAQAAGAREGAAAIWPRFQGDNLERNLDLVARLESIADRHGLTVAQLAFAWVAAQGRDIVPLVGTRRSARLLEAVEAVGIELTGEELATIDELVPAGAAAGARYPQEQMDVLDSEAVTA